MQQGSAEPAWKVDVQRVEHSELSKDARDMQQHRIGQEGFKSPLTISRIIDSSGKTPVMEHPHMNLAAFGSLLIPMSTAFNNIFTPINVLHSSAISDAGRNVIEAQRAHVVSKHVLYIRKARCSVSYSSTRSLFPKRTPVCIAATKKLPS